LLQEKKSKTKNRSLKEKGEVMQLSGMHHTHHLPTMSPARSSGTGTWHPPAEPAIGDPMRVTTAVAVEKDKNSNFAVKWAIENLLCTNHIHNLILVHVINRVHLNRRYLSLLAVFILIISFFISFL
jgi:hypothetical protein